MPRTTRRISIPKQLANDPPTKRLLMQWKHHHERFRLYSKRLWRRPGILGRASGEREKRRRKAKWKILQSILEIEHYCIGWCAELTEHPDIWTPPRAMAMTDIIKRGTVAIELSQRAQLLNAYYASRRILRGLSGRYASDGYTLQSAVRKRLRKEQRELIVQIRGLDRLWMTKMFAATHPGVNPPAPLKLSPTDLRPRKTKSARHALYQEINA